MRISDFCEKCLIQSYGALIYIYITLHEETFALDKFAREDKIARKKVRIKSYFCPRMKIKSTIKSRKKLKDKKM